MFLRLTWDPGDTLSQKVCLYPLTGECWNGLATLPTQLKYSTNTHTHTKRRDQSHPPPRPVCTVKVKHMLFKNQELDFFFLQTEHSSSEVWTQPERSFRTQQAELRSTALFSLISSCTCLSCRMHGEYLAPKWIRAS